MQEERTNTMKSNVLRRMTASTLAIALSFAGLPTTALAQEPLREGECANAQERFPDNNPGPGSLKSLRPLEIPDLNTYVRNRTAAIALGKALFWDMQVGSDGIQACASCHFRAGADPRSINQANFGGNDNPNKTVHVGLNYQLTEADFPLRKVADPTNRNSRLIRDNDDVISSQGIKTGRFLAVLPGFDRDFGVSQFDPVFNLRGLNVRRNEPRNSPTVINTGFNRNLFWDGRAQTIFNGLNEWGVRDVNARVLRANGLNQLAAVKVRIDNAAFASLAVGPPLSLNEMSFSGRDFQDIGKRLVSAKPLKKQRVSRTDSVLGSFVDRDDDDADKGLDTTYKAMVEAAFQPQWWMSNLIVVRASNGTLSFVPRPNRPLLANEYTMTEYNFSLFFGLSMQLYANTLISDDSPVDRFFEGNTNALTRQQIRGLGLFTGGAACAACHSGAETTNNSNRILLGTVVNGVRQPTEIMERMFNGNCEVIAYDQSFYNIGVRPTAEDLGHGANDPFGNPLAMIDIYTKPRNTIPSQELFTLQAGNIANPPFAIGERTSTQGAFKVPSLRNIELTAPYFHNGGQATLRQAIEFYNRGGDFRERNSQFIDFEIGKLSLTEAEIDDLVAFLKGFTDQRVVRRSAPFDHPELIVPNGHKTVGGFPVPDLDGVKDEFLTIPAVGRNGGAPLKGFLER
jgi:cytochrome c peroxidase